MTLEGHFTLNFTTTISRLRIYFYILTVELVFISCDHRRCAEADRDPQNI